MKRTAYLVKTSREVPPSSTRRPSSGRSARAVSPGPGSLDVFDEEPLPPEHPFRHLPGTVINPHLGYVTEETYRLFYEEGLENVRAYLGGTPIRVLARA